MDTFIRKHAAFTNPAHLKQGTRYLMFNTIYEGHVLDYLGTWYIEDFHSEALHFRKPDGYTLVEWAPEEMLGAFHPGWADKRYASLLEWLYRCMEYGSQGFVSAMAGYDAEQGYSGDMTAMQTLMLAGKTMTDVMEDLRKRLHRSTHDKLL